MRTAVLALLAAALLSPVRTTAAEIETAGQPIEALYAVLVECLKGADELGLEGRRAKIAPAVAETYDLSFMAKKILGGHWGQLDEADQKRWIGTFGKLTSATYAEQMTGFTGQVFEVLKVEPSQRGTALVYSQVLTPGQDPIAINYRMRPDGDSWRIIDVYLNGTVSELALRRSEYKAVLQRDGFETLVASIDAKIAAGQMAGDTLPAKPAKD